MQQHRGLYFPDGERHFIEYKPKIWKYGKADRDAAYKYVKRWRRALDVGANVGLFARDFASRFEEVVAFEPMPATRECLALNVPPNVRIEPYAASDRDEILHMYRMTSSGGSFIMDHPEVPIREGKPKPGRSIEVHARPLDSFEFDAVDLIKCDIQGAEYVALLGARETILRHRPVLLVEEKAINDEHAKYISATDELLKSLGLQPREKVQTDRVYVFND